MTVVTGRAKVESTAKTTTAPSTEKSIRNTNAVFKPGRRSGTSSVIGKLRSPGLVSLEWPPTIPLLAREFERILPQRCGCNTPRKVVVYYFKEDENLSELKTDLSEFIAENFGANATYVETLLGSWRTDPALVDESWRTYFEELLGESTGATTLDNGRAVTLPQ